MKETGGIQRGELGVSPQWSLKENHNGGSHKEAYLLSCQGRPLCYQQRDDAVSSEVCTQKLGDGELGWVLLNAQSYSGLKGFSASHDVPVFPSCPALSTELVHPAGRVRHE